MKKRITIASLVLAATVTAMTASQAIVTLYDNSNITTGIGTGANGANVSIIAAANSSTYGYSENSISATASLAEDFSLSGTSSISFITFDAYSTSTYPNPPVSPFTGATVKIWSAQPGTAGATVLFTSTTLSATAWTGVYRAQTSTPTNAQRPVFSLSVGFTGVTLPAGSYWASWGVTALVAPGVTTSVFNPPLMNTDGTMPSGNGLQSTDGGTTWISTLDGTFTTQSNRFPLTVTGTAVPEPTSVVWVALAGFGLVTIVRRRRMAA